MSARAVRSGLYAVMTIDPGGTTGCARGVFDFDAGTMAREIVADAAGRGEVESWEVGGPPPQQGWEIASEFTDWATDLNLSGRLALNAIDLVFETFELRQRHVELSPVAVTNAVLTLLQPPDWYRGADGRAGWRWDRIEWQQPSDAMRVDRRRLEACGLWSLGRGSDHRHDALRHLVVRVNRELAS